MKTLAIIGASGYVGSRLVQAFSRNGSYRVKALTRTGRIEGLNVGGAELAQGDLLSPDTLKDFLEPGCIVVNLVYLWDAGEDINIVAMRNLIAECKTAQICRLIHVSTAAVTGRAGEDLIDETTVCMPSSQYGITKLKVEAVFREEAMGAFDLVILRPTAVYGPGGEPLSKLANELIAGHSFRNYLKSILFGQRRMNLVYIDNLLAAVSFVIQRGEAFGGEIFIVSDDDAVDNNFLYIESALIRGFGLPGYRLPRLFLPLGLLANLLRLLGRNNVNPRCNYSGQKLRQLGFQPPIGFEAGLSGFITSYPFAPSTQENTYSDT